MQKSEKRKVGYVALIGRPNSGKSTFVNHLLDEKVSIVSPLPQTTQKTLRGIYTDDNCQIIFFDPAGINESEKQWNNSLNTHAKRAIDEADVVVRFIDTSRPYGSEEENIEDILQGIKTPVIKAYTKIDDLKYPLPEELSENVVAMSSVSGEGIPDLLTVLMKHLPEGPMLYPDDMYTDQDVFTRVSEIIRGKVFHAYTEEIPHSVYVEISDYEDLGGLLKIHAEIFCETESQKKILIGKNAQKIKEISTSARYDIQALFEKKCFLVVRVKVKKNWRKDQKLVKKLLG